MDLDSFHARGLFPYILSVTISSSKLSHTICTMQYIWYKKCVLYRLKNHLNPNENLGYIPSTIKASQHLT